ncbi:signal recognition particle-docking protein FtsY [Acetivibrio sp. MSJd-27]|uniref:signal recognition particle-docking protein FtsY n=1 Tax=Acetivibrio sp. MSJd-27 TaxID=2841523 RepID=UPI001C0F834C|nr:signal recognition particle-docking protein FtsY [Acetivibrio sp. MSJd-27]MBU5449874.1 signal recognition particle-docking protein FtsY [Acetivibrio sp. MSJd-27]
MAFFDKLKQGLQKTRNVIKDRIDDVFSAFQSVDEELFEELEEVLISADVGVEASLEIIEQLRQNIKEKKINDAEEAKQELFRVIKEILEENDTELKLSTSPSIILVVGVNGVGKTTSIGKLANQLKQEGKSVMMAAGDTFRAAASEQLSIWADRTGVPLVKHQEGADPAAVIYDAITSAKAKHIDVLICDTAGRLHNKKNLMDELNKMFRVIQRELPDADLEVLLALDATTGQNAVIQAEEFTKQTNVTGIILTKLDGTAKGGIVIAICKKKSIPVKFIGVGEGLDDFKKFDADEFATALLY